MSNGYGSSSGSGNRTGGQSNQRRTNPQGRVAPEGFHYMPDGTLMSDVEHNKLYGGSSEIRGRNTRLSDTSNDPCVQNEFNTPAIPSQSLSSSTMYHTWEICGFYTNLGSTIVVIPAGQLIGQVNYWTNPLAPYPYQQTTHFNMFYTWATQQVGPIVINDRIEFDISMPQLPWGPSTPLSGGRPTPGVCLTSFTGGLYSGTGTKICMRYLGQITPASGINGFIMSNTVATISLNTCDCKNFGIDPTSGESPREREPTYNCVKKKVMGQGTGGTPYTYSCEEVYYPLFGTYTSLTGTPVATGGPQLPGVPTVYANDGCLANCGPQTNTGPKPFGGALYYEK
jgi:hypothetical protein